jgi:Na+/phosphate symporter
MITVIPALVALVGVLIYAISTNGKAQEIGRIMFWTGLFFTLWALAGQTVKLF